MKIHLLFLLTAAALVGRPMAGSAQVAPDLGAASSFRFFTAVGAFNNVGTTVIKGDIGTNAGAFNGFPPGVVTGVIHVADATSTQAADDVEEAYSYLSDIPCVTPLAVYGGPVSNPQVLIAGSYCVSQATTLAGSLILDGQNNPNAMFFLRVSGALTTDEGSTVTLTNGASINNVYWQVAGRTDLGHNSVFAGTLIADGAINLIEGATLRGRGLSRAGAITLDTNTAVDPTLTGNPNPNPPVVTATVWLGNRTMDWFTNLNWSAGVPTSTLAAIIPTNTAPYPVVATNGAAAQRLTIGTGASLTLNGGTLDIKRNLNNSGTITATAGTVTLSGTTTQVIGGTGSTQFWNLTIANNSGAIQAGAVGIHGALTLPTGNLTTNNQAMTLLSDAAGTGLVANGLGVVNGAAIVQRFITATPSNGLGYRQYSSPVQSTRLSDLATTGFVPVFTQTYNTQGNTATPFPNVFEYRETRVTSPENTVDAFDQGFYVPLATDFMTVMGGYTVNIAGDKVIDLRGRLNNGSQLRTNLTRGIQPQSGWHLLGNPYPSPIDLSILSGVTRDGIDDAVYISESTGQYEGTYRSYVNGQGGDPVLPAMQAFFVRVKDPDASGTFGLNNTSRITSSSVNPTFKRGTSDTRPAVQLRLQGSSAALADNAYVYFEQGASSVFDSRFDAYKLSNSSGLNVGSLAAGQELSINGLPLLTTTTTLPLTVRVPAVGTYSLTAANLANFATGTQVLLLDTQTGARIDLRKQAAYSFQADAKTLPGRFALSFSPAGALAAKNTLLAEQVQLFPNPARGRFTLLLPAELGRTAVQVSLRNQLGQLVSQRTVDMTAAGATSQFEVSNLALGVYSLRITSGTMQVVKRVVVE